LHHPPYHHKWYKPFPNWCFFCLPPFVWFNELVIHKLSMLGSFNQTLQLDPAIKHGNGQPPFHPFIPFLFLSPLKPSICFRNFQLCRHEYRRVILSLSLCKEFCRRCSVDTSPERASWCLYPWPTRNRLGWDTRIMGGFTKVIVVRLEHRTENLSLSYVVCPCGNP
jgi:hypothetical protein